MRAAFLIGGLVLVVVAVVFHNELAIVTKTATKAGESSEERDSSLVVAILAFGGICIFAAALLARISELTLPGGAGIKLEGRWTADASAAAAQTGGVDDDSQDAAGSLLDLRVTLEERLTWLAKHFVGPDGEVLGFLTPASLRRDRYLTGEQMRTALRILSTSPDVVRSASPDWAAFVDDGNRLVKGIRVSALQEKTFHILKGHEEWTVSESIWRRGRRPDVIVASALARRVRVAPVFPYQRTDAIKAAGERLIAEATTSVIVVPRRSPSDPQIDARVAKTGGVPVVYLDDLEAWIKSYHETSADQANPAA